MVLLWFLLAFMMAFLIGRYNESNKLFWQLVLSFAIGISGAYVVERSFFNEEEKDVIEHVNSHPTQGLSSSSVFGLLAELTETTPSSENSNLVNSVNVDYNTSLSNIIVDVDGDINRITSNPPIKLCLKHFLTPVDLHKHSRLAHLLINL